MKNIIYILILAVIGFGIFSLVVNSVEKKECRQWQTQDKKVWSQWQIDQCNHHNLPLPNYK